MSEQTVTLVVVASVESLELLGLLDPQAPRATVPRAAATSSERAGVMRIGVEPPGAARTGRDRSIAQAAAERYAGRVAVVLPESNRWSTLCSGWRRVHPPTVAAGGTV